MLFRQTSDYDILCLELFHYHHDKNTIQIFLWVCTSSGVNNIVRSFLFWWVGGREEGADVEKENKVA